MTGAHHRIESRPAFHVVGLSGKFGPESTGGIPALWERFVAREASIPGRVGEESFGVCVCPPGGDGSTFDYTACVAVASLDRVPEEMVGFTIPAGTYAVFTHRGPIGRITETIRSIWGQWIPGSGLQPTGAPDFERYDHRFRGDAPENELEIWVPVAAG